MPLDHEERALLMEVRQYALEARDSSRATAQELAQVVRPAVERVWRMNGDLERAEGAIAATRFWGTLLIGAAMLMSIIVGLVTRGRAP